MKTRKVAQFEELVSDLERFISSGERKTAEAQGHSECSPPSVSSDPEAADLHPAGIEDATDSPETVVTEMTTHVDDKAPATPRTEGPERKLVSPSSKIASSDPFLSILQDIKNESFGASKTASVIDEDTADAISRKLAQFAADREYGSRLAEGEDDGFYRSPIGRKVAELSQEGYSSDQISQWVAEQGYLAGYNKAASDLAEADPAQQAIGELEAMVASGEISEEEALEAAQEIDAQLEGGGDMADEGGAGGEDPAAAASQVLLELVESGEISEDEALEAAQEIDAELGSAGPEADVQEIAAEELASLVESGQITPEEAEEAAIEIDALVSGEGGGEDFEEVDEGAEEEPAEDAGDDEGDDEDPENRKEASWNFKVASSAGVQEVFSVMDHLCDRGVLSEGAAVDILNSAQQGDSRKLAAALTVHNAIVDLARSRKVANEMADPMAEPMGGEADAGAPPAPAAPSPAPAGGGGSPGGDPNAAIDQLLGALEQLVALGVVQEDAAVQAVQGLGLIPDEAAGAAPAAPAAAPAAPATPPAAGAPPAM